MLVKKRFKMCPLEDQPLRPLYGNHHSADLLEASAETNGRKSRSSEIAVPQDNGLRREGGMSILLYLAAKPRQQSSYCSKLMRPLLSAKSRIPNIQPQDLIISEIMRAQSNDLLLLGLGEPVHC